MFLTEFVEYIVEHSNEEFCSVCHKWSGSNQEEYNLCCYNSKNSYSTLEHLRKLAKETSLSIY